MELGIALGPRDFTCTLCGREYTRVTCDFIVPVDTVCAECFEELGDPGDQELWEHIARRRAEAESEPDEGNEGGGAPSPT